MTKTERLERNQHIIDDIKAKMTNKELYDKYGLKDTAIQNILKENGYTRNGSTLVQIEKTGGGTVFEDNQEDIIEQLMNALDTAYEQNKELSMKINKLESETANIKNAQINTATIGYITPDEDHYIIGVKPFDDVPGVPPKAYTLEEALELFAKYRPMMAEDQVMDTLKKYGHTNRDCGKIYFKASSGSSINDYNFKFNEINIRLDKLEERLANIEEQL